MFGNCQAGGMNLAPADVCKTPTPAGPVPIPYPNISQGTMAVGFFPKVIWVGGPAHNLLTQVPLSNGDQAGAAGGVVSSMIMGPTRHTAGSTKVILGSAPASRMTSPTTQNQMNAVGLALAPAQTKVLLLG